MAMMLLTTLMSTAQVPVGRREGNGYYGNNAAQEIYKQQIVILEVGGKAEVYLPSFIRELRPSSVNFRSNDYIDVVTQNRDYCTIRGRKSTRATQLICHFRWDEIVSGKKINHEDHYSFNVQVLRVEPEGVSLPQITTVGWDCSKSVSPVLYPKSAECGFTYRIADMSIATVSTGGVIVGRQLGETELTVTTSNGFSATGTVRVVIPQCEDVKFEASTKDFDYVGDEMDLTPEISPSRAKPQLTWESSDPNILTVDQNGHVKAISEGKAAIWLYTDNGKKYYKNYKVKVPKKK